MFGAMNQTYIGLIVMVCALIATPFAQAEETSPLPKRPSTLGETRFESKKEPVKKGAADDSAAPKESASPKSTTPRKKKAPEAQTAVSSSQRLSASGPHPLVMDLPRPAHFTVIALHEEVSLGMASFVRRVAESLGKGDVLLLDINTFGGRLDAAVSIRDVLLQAKKRGVRTVAYINPRAISAGALISYATEVIVVDRGATIGASAPIQMGGGEAKPAGEKVVSYLRKEMRATAEVYGRSGEIAEAMVDMDVKIPGLIDKGKLLTLDGKAALKWGLASFEAKDRATLIRELGYHASSSFTVKEQGWNWGEKLAGWISSAVVSSLLMSIGMLGLMIGLYTGGSPLPLSLGASCLFLFFFGQYVTHLAGMEDFFLLLFGVALVGVEVFLPGYLIPGLLGVLCIIGALMMGLVDFEKVPFSVQWEAGTVVAALAKVFGSILATAVMAWGAARIIPRSRFGRALVLATEVQGRAMDHRAAEKDALVGQKGVAQSDLRPSGKVKIGGRRVEALAEHGYIERGQTVKVVRRQGYQVVVAAIKEEQP